eukprot:CAMPEP_0202980036 /NCGR_PEP_ID=MMETSP1396-20130829/86032_1 /ASSEMBLY_ACC=CAM_ASM_000872 /TAXON_ID= /ORGANISM="Pseudokeronopsis sp., Strain Brazil" /LENGTH=71 /DNA_ID=CAMNT_0049719751 /DNA_START=761 /DNA_END=973 /DNA_ORIENTATION=-
MTGEIKGKMSGEHGTVFPHILVQDNIEEVLLSLKNQFKQYAASRSSREGPVVREGGSCFRSTNADYFERQK